MSRVHTVVSVWLIEPFCGWPTYQRLGEARRLADGLETELGAIVSAGDPAQLVAHGADLVVAVTPAGAGVTTLLAAAETVLRDHPVRVVFGSGYPDGRMLAARLAVRMGWRLITPALMVTAAGGEVTVTALDATGRRARQVELPRHGSAVVTLRDGVADPIPADPDRQDQVVHHHEPARTEAVVVRRRIPVDSATVDIRQDKRLVCGGRGLGGPDGFRKLARVARLLEAGLAASRVAVDEGWIEADRQIGQTGKTVRPDLYIGCGVSGATHHVEGMAESEHIVAINTDPEAPLFRRAHLGLVADVHHVLECVERGLDERRQ